MTVETHPCTYCGGVLLPATGQVSSATVHTIKCADCGDIAYAAVDTRDIEAMIAARS